MSRNLQQPIIVLSEGSQRVKGRNAQKMNIEVAKLVAQAVKTTLGPKGMDKMLVDELGDITITNDGATILENMSIDHPIGKMLVEVSKTQDNEVGDGTTTAVTLAGELLGEAERLLEQDIHPSIIIKGYRMAAEKSQEVLNELSDSINLEDKENLKSIAKTSMTGKASEGQDVLAELVINALQQVAEQQDGANTVNLDHVKIEKKTGSSVKDSSLIKGIVIDKERVHPGMPKEVKGAKIALLDAALEVKETETDAKIQITDPSQLQAFLDQEETMIKQMVDKIKASGATVVLCQKGIDDLAQHFLSKQGILAVRRVKKSDMENIASATGARIETRVQDLTEDALGFAGKVTEKKIAGDEMIFIEECKEPKAVTILIRGGASHVIDEAERAVHDALGSVSSAIEDGKVLVGGGSVQVGLSLRLKEYAKTVGGREQLAIESFASALEIIPKTLAETAGMDSIDLLVELRAKHAEENGKYYGVNVFTRKVENMQDLKVIEPTKLHKQAISSASEAAELILRIDDIIAAQSGGAGGAPPGMPPGAGGMGGMDF